MENNDCIEITSYEVGEDYCDGELAVQEGGQGESEECCSDCGQISGPAQLNLSHGDMFYINGKRFQYTESWVGLNLVVSIKEIKEDAANAMLEAIQNSLQQYIRECMTTPSIVTAQPLIQFYQNPVPTTGTPLPFSYTVTCDDTGSTSLAEHYHLTCSDSVQTSGYVSGCTTGETPLIATNQAVSSVAHALTNAFAVTV